MALATKTLQKAQALAEAPVLGYFLAARVHPAVALLPTGVLILAFMTGQFLVQVFATVLLVMSLFLTLGRSIAITRDEIVLLQGWPPLWRPRSVIRRLPRAPIPVEAKRLYWKLDLDGESLWVNKAFSEQVQLIADHQLERGGRRAAAAEERSADAEPAAPRERQVVSDSKRITPKGSRNRKPRKYRR